MINPSVRDDAGAGGALWAVIECPRGQGVRTRVDEHGRAVPVRTLPPGVFYPYNYGFIERTRVADGEELDVFVLGPTARAGSRLRVTLLGAVAFSDSRGDDPKLIALAQGVSPDEDIDAIAARVARFLRDYKPASEPRTVGGLLTLAQAEAIVERARGAFASGAG